MILPFLIAWLATKINCHQAHVIAYLREENRQVEQERSPPLHGRSLGRRLANPNHFMGSRASNTHRIVVSATEDSRQRVSDYSPGKASSTDSYARAA